MAATAVLLLLLAVAPAGARVLVSGPSDPGSPDDYPTTAPVPEVVPADGSVLATEASATNSVSATCVRWTRERCLRVQGTTNTTVTTPTGASFYADVFFGPRRYWLSHWSFAKGIHYDTVRVGDLDVQVWPPEPGGNNTFAQWRDPSDVGVILGGKDGTPSAPELATYVSRVKVERRRVDVATAVARPHGTPFPRWTTSRVGRVRGGRWTYLAVRTAAGFEWPNCVGFTGGFACVAGDVDGVAMRTDAYPLVGGYVPSATVRITVWNADGRRLASVRPERTGPRRGLRYFATWLPNEASWGELHVALLDAGGSRTAVLPVVTAGG